MNVSKNILYVGVNDKDITLFEGQYVVEKGMAYNSYVIIDEKIAVFDTVDKNFVTQWLKNLENVFGDRTPDYLVVTHMEPDHSSGIKIFADKYPNATIVSNAKSFTMMKNFFGTDFADRNLAVTDGSTLSLGEHQLHFATAPMVHWPEVTVCYERTEKVLFSADAFGKFGTTDADEDWACEARRYYFGIVGKYGVQAQALLKKASALDIKTICPLHGPVLKENLGYYINLYDIWSSYRPEKEGVTIAYTTVYGNTENAVNLLKTNLEGKGVKVSVFNLAKDDMAEAVEDAFKHDRLVLATTTYNGTYFPFMREFVEHLKERNYQNRTIGFIENGSWAPVATKLMKADLESLKNITFTENNVKILSAVKDENIAQINALAEELCK